MTPNNLVHENERLDELHRNGYYIIQDPARFCFGMDAVLLSGFARARRGERVLDLGTGFISTARTRAARQSSSALRRASALSWTARTRSQPDRPAARIPIAIRA